ncbi:MAG: hypothetical protein ACRDTZ_19670 [Pseudonocardiaceae bacterium]
MTATEQHPSVRNPVLSPAVTAASGFVVFALAMFSGAMFEVNADSRLGHDHSLWEAASDSAAELAIALVGLAIAVWAGRRALAGPPSRVARTALVLAVIAVVTVPAFWSGWPNVFGAVAVGLALDSRQRLGSLGATAGTALVLGSVAFIAGAVTCVLG